MQVFVTRDAFRMVGPASSDAAEGVDPATVGRPYFTAGTVAVPYKAGTTLEVTFREALFGIRSNLLIPGVEGVAPDGSFLWITKTPGETAISTSQIERFAGDPVLFNDSYSSLPLSPGHWIPAIGP